MTDRHSGYVVVLNEDVREDYKSIIDAIRMVKGVQSVEPVDSDSIAETIWRSRLHKELRNDLTDVAFRVAFGKEPPG